VSHGPADGDRQPRDGAPRSHLGKTPLHERNVVKSAVAVATVVGALAAVVGTVLAGSAGEPTEDGHEATPPHVSPTAAPDAMTSVARPGTEQASTGPSTGARCWTSEMAPVQCSSSHSVETLPISSDDCGSIGLVGLMGGDPGLDHVRLGATTQTVDGGAACVASAADPWVGPLEDVLKANGAAAFRACLDTRLAAELTGCDDVHTVELVGPVRQDLAGADDCGQVVETYTGLVRRSLDHRLRVQLRSRGTDGSVCAIAVTGGDVLTDSLRGVGPSALPISAG
jgi:hypothetical protein